MKITPFRQLARAYGALLTASDSLSLLAQQKSESNGVAELVQCVAGANDVAKQLSTVASKIEDLSNSIERGNL